MNMTPCFWLFSALSASSVPPAEALLREMAADNAISTSACRAYSSHAASTLGAWREPSDPPTPIPTHEHALAIALMQAFPGISATESAVYRHIRDNPGMSPAEQESLQALLGDGCSMMDYFHLGESLLLGLAAEGPDATHAAAAREVIVANALRDVQRQPHVVAMLVHTRLLNTLNENRGLKHIKADVHMAQVRELADDLRAQQARGPASDIRTQVMQAEPLRDALLTFLLAEASA